MQLRSETTFQEVKFDYIHSKPLTRKRKSLVPNCGQIPIRKWDCLANK